MVIYSSHLAIQLRHEIVVSIYRHNAKTCSGVAPPLSHIAAVNGVIEPSIKNYDGDPQGWLLHMPSMQVDRHIVQVSQRQ